MSGLSKQLQDRAEDLFRNGLYCSEAILQTYDEFYNFKLPQQALKMATPFGAGIGAAKMLLRFHYRGAVEILQDLLDEAKLTGKSIS